MPSRHQIKGRNSKTPAVLSQWPQRIIHNLADMVLVKNQLTPPSWLVVFGVCVIENSHGHGSCM